MGDCFQFSLPHHSCNCIAGPLLSVTLYGTFAYTPSLGGAPSVAPGRAQALPVLSSYLPCYMDAQSARVDITDRGGSFPVSMKLNDISLLGYVKLDMEQQQDYIISAQQSPDN